MERSEMLVQGHVEEGEVKISKTLEAAEESSDPEFNPFLVEPILVKLLKLVEKVSELKELRKMCQTWDEFNLKEIEDRAFNRKVKAIDFCWTDEFSMFRTRSETEAEANLVQPRLVQFMEDTKAIPKLFSSFKFNFPESWTILSKHMDFFSIYPVTFVVLEFSSWTLKLQLFVELLTKFMESDIWGNLKEILVYSIRQPKEIFGLPSSSLFVPASGNMDRKLQKLDIKFWEPTIIEIFKSAFASGKYTNLTSMGIGHLPSEDLDFPGLDLSKLTRLEIGGTDRGSSPALKLTSGLVKLARNGMRLKNFGMKIDLTPNRIVPWTMFDDEFELFEDLPIICSNLTQFLTSQSTTLEKMSFEFVCYLKDPFDMPEDVDIWCKIHLPKFEALHTLKLWVDFQLIDENSERIYTKLFGMTHNPSVHFPKLVNMTLDGEYSLIALDLNSAPDEAEQLHLKRLEIPDRGFYDPSIWSTSFVDFIGSVEELTCPAKLLILYGERLPWGESLRSLYIYDTSIEVRQMAFFKLNHFKKLERLNAKYFEIKGQQIKAGYHYRFGDWDVKDYLNTFKEATELPLTSITFKGPKMEEELKAQFIEYFPFPVEFQIIHIPSYLDFLKKA